ncbi:MAG: tyrosine--tRNA ligase [Acidimicrobiia bacterium]|nr:tyrosine--tRNA ligase [Acidimicrobiia bacterium]NNL28037.1 tyrosine--tRNA ligase [Acidimicrobiia bacterium]
MNRDKLMRGTDTIAPESEFDEKLALDRPLRVKLGMDPTAPTVTLGWAVVLRKLRHFQEEGHTAVLIVGDFTAQVGDPSGKSATRKRLSAEEVRGYAANVLDGFRRVLLPEPLEIRYNSEWLEPLNMADVLELTSSTTVAQMLERDDFSKRTAASEPISMLEFMYPLLQGYDSVAVEADIELGGSDQLWNLLMGRAVQTRYGQPPQVAMTVPLLVGTDGVQKMSQSLGNYIGVDDDASDMFGKVMSVSDSAMEQYFRLATELEPAEIDAVLAGLNDGSLHPGHAKRKLARTIVALYHDDAAAVEAEAAFDRVFVDHGLPDDIDDYPMAETDQVWLPGVLCDAGLVTSNGEGRRMIKQGAVRIDGGDAVTTEDFARAELVGRVVQVGKRRYIRLT